MSQQTQNILFQKQKKNCLIINESKTFIVQTDLYFQIQFIM